MAKEGQINLISVHDAADDTAAGAMDEPPPQLQATLQTIGSPLYNTCSSLGKVPPPKVDDNAIYWSVDRTAGQSTNQLIHCPIHCPFRAGRGRNRSFFIQSAIKKVTMWNLPRAGVGIGEFLIRPLSRK